MPIIKSAQKQARADIRKREKNLKIKSSVKKAVKNFERSPEFKRLQEAQSEIDKAVKKGLMKKNTAARRKSALVRDAKNAGVRVIAKVKKSGEVKVVTNKAAAQKKTVAKSASADNEVVAAKKAVVAKKPGAKPGTAGKKTGPAKKTNTVKAAAKRAAKKA